jgi:hypothetical protein
MGRSEYDPAAEDRHLWNAGRMIGAKRALKPQQVWAIRFWRTTNVDYETAQCSISLLIASCAAVTS